MAEKCLHRFGLVKRQSVPVGMVALPASVPGLEFCVHL